MRTNQPTPTCGHSDDGEEGGLEEVCPGAHGVVVAGLDEVEVRPCCDVEGEEEEDGHYQVRRRPQQSDADGADGRDVLDDAQDPAGDQQLYQHHQHELGLAEVVVGSLEVHCTQQEGNHSEDVTAEHVHLQPIRGECVVESDVLGLACDEEQKQQPPHRVQDQRDHDGYVQNPILLIRQQELELGHVFATTVVVRAIDRL